jgi:glycosyltransferase involved in cell wall biosynthesis
VPHHVPEWEAERRPRGAFTVGYAGRLSPEKGLDTLVGAMRLLRPPVDLLVAGDGRLRTWLERTDLGAGRRLLLHAGVSHDAMASMYAQMDLLVLPSHSTPTWTEQFGRVLVEALWCGTPVVGSSSGEIPWVIDGTAGGVTFAEGDSAALAATLEDLRADPGRREALATEGRLRARATFAVEAVTDALEAAIGEASHP